MVLTLVHGNGVMRVFADEGRVEPCGLPRFWCTAIMDLLVMEPLAVVVTAMAFLPSRWGQVSANPVGERPANLVVALGNSFDILRVVLRDEGYRWKWVTAAGRPRFADTRDRGVRCVRDAT